MHKLASITFRDLGAWVANPSHSLVGRRFSGRVRVNDNRQTRFFRCCAATKFRIPLGDVGVVQDVKEGDTLVSEPFEDRNLGIIGLQVYTKRDSSNPIRTVCLTVGDRPIRPIVINATAEERFGFQLACWQVDETGDFPPPQELEIELSDRLILPHYARKQQPVRFLEGVELEKYYAAKGKIANMVVLSRACTNPYTVFSVPAVKKVGSKFFADPVHVLFRAIPQPADIKKKPLQSMFLRPEINNGVKYLSVLGRTADGEELLLAIFEAISKSKKYPLYLPVALPRWLRGESQMPNFYSFIPTYRAGNGLLEIKINKGKQQGDLGSYILEREKLLEHSGSHYVLVGQEERTGEKVITMHSLRGGLERERFFLFQQLVLGKDTPNRGMVIRNEGRKNRQETLAISDQYREFYHGKRKAEDVPTVTRRVRTPMTISFQMPIYLGAIAKGIKFVQIAPYDDGQHRGIQIWALEDENGIRIGDKPLKIVYYDADAGQISLYGQ